MSADILACDIRTEDLKAIPVAIEYEARFAPLSGTAETPGSQEKPEFERHN